MMSRSTFRLCLFLSVMLVVTGCGRGTGEDAEVLARVGDEVITVAEFQGELERRSEGRSHFFQDAANRRALLEELARQRMLVQEAREAGITEEPEFKALVERMMIRRLREKRLDQRMAEMAPDDEAVRAYFESNREVFTRPARRQVAMIRVDAPSTLSDEERQSRRTHIDAAREAAMALPDDTAHFGEVAVNYSDDRSSRYQGGVVGWLIEDPERRYQWPGPVLEAAFALEQPGTITPVIETPQAFYLVRLADFQPGRVQPLEQVADGIRHRLLRASAQGLEGKLMADIEQSRPIQIDEAALESIEAPPASGQDPGRRQDPPAMPVDPGEGQ